MKEKTVAGVTILEFESFDNDDCDWFRHCFSTRLGGVSEGHFSSMNFRLTGDSEQNVTENYRLICRAASISFETLTLTDQKHGTNIKTIRQSDAGSNFHKEKDFDNIDGFITNVPGINLSTFHADCAAVFLADPVNRAIGLVHAGWRGTVDKIAEAAVLAMHEEYGTKAEDIIAGIGPSICYPCFEVDEPVYKLFEEFVELRKPSEQIAGKYFIDLKSVNKKILQNIGVKAENIEISPLCTKCDDKLFYSHRRDGYMRGTMGAFMEIIRR